MLIGLLVFTAASLLPTLIPTESILLCSRFIHGIAIGIFAVSVRGSIPHLFPIEKIPHISTLFVKGMPPFGEKRTHHVHIVETTSRHWPEKILFRDYLIAHPETMREYEALKIKLADEHKNNREQYTESKAEFITAVLKKANDNSIVSF